MQVAAERRKRAQILESEGKSCLDLDTSLLYTEIIMLAFK